MNAVDLVVFDGVRTFDYAVVGEVWGPHRAVPGAPLADLLVCAPELRTVRLDTGLLCAPDHDLDALAGCGLILVPGLGDPALRPPERVLRALRHAHGRGTPIAALCAGAFVLAAAGLLDGRTATTHWALADDLARRHPLVTVDPKVLFTGDGRVWTSAGVAAGIDLCLHLVRRSHGDTTASALARAMVTAPFRAGGQAQFITTPIPPGPADTRDPIAQVCRHVQGALADSWTVAGMAAIAAMTERTFARHFTAAMGTSPRHWLLQQRLRAAQHLLENGDSPIEDIAHRCGFGTGVSLRQHFRRHLGTAPRDYRRTFRAIGRSPA
ncbi:GlxA family transcriptional regulator [Kitasatospora sp. MBT63]|uniref:GlxA family transcriptional regulator n=1 Tax=Kitasatospora sp. MBT63 TaxID=1444768 RepID=UPI00053AC3D8|nr:helix-turn-helix domain-containing protein [Kitasatospora sp. MBT63]